jgi:hypothetical protein
MPRVLRHGVMLFALWVAYAAVTVLYAKSLFTGSGLSLLAAIEVYLVIAFVSFTIIMVTQFYEVCLDPKRVRLNGQKYFSQSLNGGIMIALLWIAVVILAVPTWVATLGQKEGEKTKAAPLNSASNIWIEPT